MPRFHVKIIGDLPIFTIAVGRSECCNVGMTADRTTSYRAMTRTVFTLALTIAAVLVAAISENANATLTVSAVDRASAVEGVGTTNVVIYGGVAGDDTRCDAKSGEATCDNCRLLSTETAPLADNGLFACNNKRIYPDLKLVIYVTSDSIDNGTATITSSDGATVITNSGTTGIAKGGTGTITVLWSQICSYLGTNGTGGTESSPCIATDAQLAGTVRIGISGDGDTALSGATTVDDYRQVTIKVQRDIGQDTTTHQALNGDCDDTNAKGVCYFEMAPGDSKAVIKSLKANVGFPVSSNINFKAIRFLYSAVGFDYIHLGSDHVDLATTGTDVSTFSVSPRRIEGLTNDRLYYFKTAAIDAAGNVGYYSAAANDSVCTYATDPTSTNCHKITPSEVVGILSESNCFIATAAYGSNFAVELDTLRDFRDQVLLASEWGRSIVRFYYKNSPPLAHAIYRSDFMRATVRAALFPIVHLTDIALKHGLVAALLVGILGTTFGAIILGLALFAVFNILRYGKERVFGDHDSDHGRGRGTMTMFFLAVVGASLIGAPSARAQDDEPLPYYLPHTTPVPETAPEPEYPYPGAKEEGFTSNDEKADSTDELVNERRKKTKPKRRHRIAKPLPIPKPEAITDEGEYIYSTKVDDEERKYGDPDPIRMPTRKNVEKPETIASDGSFIYPVEQSEFGGAAGIRFGVMAPPNLSNPDNGLTFAQIYGAEDVPALLFEYEYPFTRSIGRMGIKFETGFFVKQAPGRFRRSDRVTEIPDERFTFMMVPVQTTLIYRFQYYDKQPLVPFVEGGGGYTGIAELRDDNKPPRIGGAPVMIAAGGVSFLLDWIDQQAVRELDAEYGINHVWLTAQFRQVVSLKSSLDVTSRVISAGFTVDF